VYEVYSAKNDKHTVPLYKLIKFAEAALSLSLTPDGLEQKKTVVSPHPIRVLPMAWAFSFFALLASTGKTFKEKKASTDETFGVSMLQKAQIYCIICLVNDGKEVGNERGCAPPSLLSKRTSVAAAVEVDGHITACQLAAAN